MVAWNCIRKLNAVRPLVVSNESLFYYKKGAVYKIGHDLESPSLLFNFPTVGLVSKIAKYVRFVDRIFRSSPSHAIIFDNALFIARRSQIWRYDFYSGNLSLDFNIPDGRRSLAFGEISKIDGSKELVFGEYFSNPTRQPVRIWGRKSGYSNWLQVAEFGAGEIEHIHSVAFVKNQVYILTGDFGKAAGIWISDTEFSDLQSLLRGLQDYRAAWLESINDRVFMATDTQLEFNFLYELLIDNGLSLHPLKGLNGSSIYFGRGPKDIFFSTTVECGKPTGNFLRDLFDIRTGPGILSSKACLMSIDGKGFISEIFTAKKDRWPFRLAQFGTFIFPTGTMPTGTLYVYCVALECIDGACLVFRSDNHEQS